MKFRTMYKQPNFTQYMRIGSIIPKGCITLFTGLPATGKSYTLLKFLNQENIKPFVFNLDSDPTLANFNFIGMTDDKSALLGFLDGKVDDLDNEVIVIDTDSRMMSYYGSGINTQKDQIAINQVLQDLCLKHGYTIIVLAHPEDYVGKSSVFKDNPYLIRDCHEHLHLDKIMSSGRKLEPCLYRFYINKARGLGGTRTIDNWLRE